MHATYIKQNKNDARKRNKLYGGDLNVTLATELCPFDIKTLNEWTTQTELAEILKVDRATVFRYQRLAKILIQDYKDAYSERIPLNRYQCWVIIRLHDAFRVFKNKKFITDNIRKNPSSFSKYTFRKSTGL